ncbi:hypothetical protein AB0I53_15300 [Saccharopolyspora sp. NPDC050389]|uniref:hypothetical protein n=1 Tax=Saccharopolyspora sp. NPDC050389 TaxID=3155516 RepID=UPI0033C6B7E7
MRRYTVHLLFHLLAIAAGAACGIAGGLWWFGDDPSSLWLAVGALAVGVIVLILESLYISADQPSPPSPPRPPRPPLESRPRIPVPPREHTRPDLEPVAAPPSDTLLQPSMDAGRSVDQETKTSAIDALDEQWGADRSTRQV